ncbi:MAG: hypothetical protein IJ451_02555 [Ruminococcus sp.]|nr:hypothetical protein [Ruminococcus sp.]
MVTEQQMNSIDFLDEPVKSKNYYKVNPSDMSRFDDNRKKLAFKINSIVLSYELENDLSRNKTGEIICEKTQQSWDSYKKVIYGKTSASRTLLYKFCIGMNLSLAESAELFDLSEEGPLNEKVRGDYIFLNALGKDSIQSFIKEYEEYTQKKISLRDSSR